MPRSIERRQSDVGFKMVLSFNNFSKSTGQRLLASGKGPRFVLVSEKRIGVTVGENRRWQQSRQGSVRPPKENPGRAGRAQPGRRTIAEQHLL